MSSGKRYYNFNSNRQPAKCEAHTFVGTGIGESFETISNNLKVYPYYISYGVDGISSIIYDLGGSLHILKTFNYTLGVLTSIVLSGNVPLGIALTKTLNYTGDDLTDVIYS